MQKKKRSRSVMSHSLPPHGLQPTRLLGPWDFPGMKTEVGCYFLLQGIFLTQGSNLGLPHCRQMPYRLSYQGSPIRNNQIRKISVWQELSIEAKNSRQKFEKQQIISIASKYFQTKYLLITKEQYSDFTVVTLDRHHLKQLVKVNIQKWAVTS